MFKIGWIILFITILLSIIITVVLQMLGLPIYFFIAFLPIVSFPILGSKHKRSEYEGTYCPNCGYSLEGWEQYCPNCGYKLK